MNTMGEKLNLGKHIEKMKEEFPEAGFRDLRQGRGKKWGCVYYFFPEDIATKITAEDEEEAIEELKEEGNLKPRDVVMVRSKYLKKLKEV